MGLELIVFDCDGVILESLDCKTRAFAHTVREYGGEASQKLVDYHLAHGGVSRMEKFRWFHTQVLGRDILPHELDAMCARFAEACLDEVLASPFVPGAMECITRQHGRLPMCVASGTPHSELALIFTKRELERYFAMILGSPPGKTELLATIVREMGANPERTLMVGDSITDLQAAQQVGTLFYGRGRFFADKGCPWGEDLTLLSEHITTLA